MSRQGVKAAKNFHARAHYVYETFLCHVCVCDFGPCASQHFCFDDPAFTATEVDTDVLSKQYIHCKNFVVVLTNKDGYLSCTFVHGTLATEQRYIHVQRMHKMSSKRLNGRVSESMSLLSMTEE